MYEAVRSSHFPLTKFGLFEIQQWQIRPCEYDLNHGSWGPVTGGTIAIIDLFYDFFTGVLEIVSELIRVPNVGQKGESSKSSLPTHFSAQSPMSSRSKMDDKIIGERAAKGLGRMTKEVLRSPMAFSVGMAQGAHNLPKVWGDKTVRPQEKITGIGSGLKAASKVSKPPIPNLTHEHGLSSTIGALDDPG